MSKSGPHVPYAIMPDGGTFSAMASSCEAFSAAPFDDDVAECDFYTSPTILSRLILFQDYKAAAARSAEDLPGEAKVWICAKQNHSNDECRATADHDEDDDNHEHNRGEYRIRQLPIHMACKSLALAGMIQNHSEESEQQRAKSRHQGRNDLEKLICQLVLAYPLGCGQRDHTGNLPLHDAVRNNASHTTLSALLMAAPEAVEARDPSGRTACDLSSLRSGTDQSQVLKLLKRPRAFWLRACKEAHARLEMQQNIPSSPATSQNPSCSQQATTDAHRNETDLASKDAELIASLTACMRLSPRQACNQQNLQQKHQVTPLDTAHMVIRPLHWSQLEQRTLRLEGWLAQANSEKDGLRKLVGTMNRQRNADEEKATTSSRAVEEELERLRKENATLRQEHGDLQAQLRMVHWCLVKNSTKEEPFTTSSGGACFVEPPTKPGRRASAHACLEASLVSPGQPTPPRRKPMLRVQSAPHPVEAPPSDLNESPSIHPNTSDTTGKQMQKPDLFQLFQNDALTPKDPIARDTIPAKSAAQDIQPGANKVATPMSEIQQLQALRSKVRALHKRNLELHQQRRSGTLHLHHRVSQTSEFQKDTQPPSKHPAVERRHVTRSINPFSGLFSQTVVAARTLSDKILLRNSAAAANWDVPGSSLDPLDGAFLMSPGGDGADTRVKETGQEAGRNSISNRVMQREWKTENNNDREYTVTNIPAFTRSGRHDIEFPLSSIGEENNDETEDPGLHIQHRKGSITGTIHIVSTEDGGCVGALNDVGALDDDASALTFEMSLVDSIANTINEVMQEQHKDHEGTSWDEVEDSTTFIHEGLDSYRLE